MKLPNGYGSVSKLKGKRRKPWAVRKTVGKTGDNRPVTRYVGYYASRSEALAALASYNKHPYKGVTMNELYEAWISEAGLSESTERTYRYTWSHIGMQGDRDMNKIRLDDLQDVFDGISSSNGKTLKNIISGIYLYAIRHEYVQPEKAAMVSYLRTSEPVKQIERKVFSSEEIENCKDHAVRVLLYSGLRISELLGLTPECIHLDERYLDIKKSKTKAGIRKVPIADKIMEDVKALDCFGMDYRTFRRRHFDYPDHTVHDTRHTFISRLVELGTDPRTVKILVGHAGTGVTETVYTHLNLQTLLDAVNQL